MRNYETTILKKKKKTITKPWLINFVLVDW